MFSSNHYRFHPHMLQLGFVDEWVSWVLRCVSIVSFQVKVTGELYLPLDHLEGVIKGTQSPHTRSSCVGEGRCGFSI